LKIYTKKGDKGKTNLFGTDKRISKASKRVKSYGEIDELNSFIGLAISGDLPKEFSKILRELDKIQGDLFVIGAELATISNDNKIANRIKKKDVKRLENIIDSCSEELEPLKNFILPGGSSIAAIFHICRTVCRRAERNIVDLSEEDEVNEEIITYLNRLSDLFFILARYSNKILDVEDVKWN
tara:strand:- start:274 stop:822 length:549 start_codon:yes stop_codon:yes gene_type:complete